MNAININSKLPLSLAIIVSVSSAYIPSSKLRFSISFVVLLLLSLDLRNRIRDFCSTLKELSRIQIWILVVTITSAFVAVITLFVGGSSISLNSQLYPDALLTTALISQFSLPLQSRPLFGFDASLDYYFGAFSFFGRLHDIYPIPPYDFLVYLALPYLTMILFLTLYVAVYRSLIHVTPSLIISIFLFLLFSNGNFLIQPNIDDRPLALLPYTSLTQFLALILFFDLFSLSHRSKLPVKIIVMQIVTLLIAICLVKPTLLVSVALLFFTLFTSRIRLRVFIYTLVFTFAFMSISIFFYPSIIVYSPQFPSLRSDSFIFLFATLVLINHVKSKVEFSLFVRLACCFLSLQTWLFVFDIYGEKGSEIWFLEPLRIILLLQLASAVITRRKLTHAQLIFTLSILSIYVIETILELTQIPATERNSMSLFLLFLTGSYWILRATSPSPSAIDFLRTLASQKIPQLVAVITILASFNPLLLIQSSGLVKNGSESVSGLLSERDMVELRSIGNILENHDVTRTLVFSNNLCANSVFANSIQFANNCDSRVFLVSGLLHYRNPLENWKFPVWKSERVRQRQSVIVSDYVKALKSSVDFDRWLSTYSDPIIDNPNRIFLLVDNFSTIKVSIDKPLIFSGQRFLLYSLMALQN